MASLSSRSSRRGPLGHGLGGEGVSAGVSASSSAAGVSASSASEGDGAGASVRPSSAIYSAALNASDSEGDGAFTSSVAFAATLAFAYAIRVSLRLFFSSSRAFFLFIFSSCLRS